MQTNPRDTKKKWHFENPITGGLFLDSWVYRMLSGPCCMWLARGLPSKALPRLVPARGSFSNSQPSWADWCQCCSISSVKLSSSMDNRKAKYSTLVFWLTEEVGRQVSILSCWLLVLAPVAVAQTMQGWDTAYFWDLVKAPVHKQRYLCNLPHLDIWGQFHFPFVGHPSSSLQVPPVRKWGTGKKQIGIIEKRVTLHYQSLETTLQKSKANAMHCTCSVCANDCCFLYWEG